MLLKAAYGVLQITLGVTSEVDVDFLYQLRKNNRGLISKLKYISPSSIK